jgi:hypothetical protein
MASQRISDAAAEPMKPHGCPFQPGQSGNPSGRPNGSANKATIAVEALLENEAEALTRKVLELVRGSLPAIRLCFERGCRPGVIVGSLSICSRSNLLLMQALHRAQF